MGWPRSRPKGDPEYDFDPERESLDAQEPAEGRFTVEITDHRTGHSLSVDGGTAFVAMDKLRATLSRPELVMTGEVAEADPWGASS